MREWSEQHIKDLIKRTYIQMGGGGGDLPEQGKLNFLKGYKFQPFHWTACYGLRFYIYYVTKGKMILHLENTSSGSDITKGKVLFYLPYSQLYIGDCPYPPDGNAVPSFAEFDCFYSRIAFGEWLNTGNLDSPPDLQLAEISDEGSGMFVPNLDIAERGIVAKQRLHPVHGMHDNKFMYAMIYNDDRPLKIRSTLEVELLNRYY